MKARYFNIFVVRNCFNATKNKEVFGSYRTDRYLYSLDYSGVVLCLLEAQLCYTHYCPNIIKYLRGKK